MVGYEAIPGSLHKLTKIWNRFTYSSKFHFFCPSCSVLLKSINASEASVKKVWCNDCKDWSTATVRKGSNYFITISIKAQIQNVLRKFGRFISFSPQGLRDLRDIGDGEMMQCLAGVIGTRTGFCLSFSVLMQVRSSTRAASQCGL